MSRLDRTQKKHKKKSKSKSIPKISKIQNGRGTLNTVGRMLGGVDYRVLGMIVLLSVFGMLMVFSAGYYTTVTEDVGATYYLRRQGLYVLTGFVLLIISSNIDYHDYAKFSNAAMVTSLALLVAVLLVGQSSHGAQRWLGIGPIGITPSEFSKVFMIIFTAAFITANKDAVKSRDGLIVLFAIMFLHFALIVKQPNLSTAIVIVAIMLGIMFVAGMSLKIIGGLIGLGALGTVFILKFMKDSHWYARLTNWIDPFADAQGEGYQVSQSIIALGNGGLKGLGFGNSISKNLYLPEPTNDFILAIIGEELGYIGFLLLMMAYVYLLFRLILIAIKAKDSLGFYLGTGVAVMLGLQVIINVAVVTASMPATGITLPFISYGGSSIWAFMIAMGISLNISKNSKGSLR